MKKIITLLVIFVLVLLSVLTITASADFGLGVELSSIDVKMIKTGLRGEKLCFSDADFKAALCIPDFKSITITSIPKSTEGTLLFAGRRIGEGKVIRRSNIASLVFIPASQDVKECKFSFTIDGYAGNNSIDCIMKFIDKINYEPSVNLSDGSELVIKTQEEIGTYGRLVATDPENDKIEFIIVSYPKNGYITLTDKHNGHYRYTPSNNYKGSDSFTYVARDEYGNYSVPVTVTVKVSERMCETVYADMTERSEYNAAVAMTAMGIMNGTISGNNTYFSPDATVTKAEFLSMAMKLHGISPDSTASKTFFDDNADIPESLIGFVSVAQRAGIVKGDFENGRLVFKPNAPITKYEAARIMAELLDAKSDSEEEKVFADDGIPLSARGAVYAMYSLGIYDETTSDLCGNVTRADAASYLYRMAS